MADLLSSDPASELMHDIEHKLRGPYCTLQGLMGLVDLEGMTEVNMNYIRNEIKRINRVSSQLMKKYAISTTKIGYKK